MFHDPLCFTVTRWLTVDAFFRRVARYRQIAKPGGLGLVVVTATRMIQRGWGNSIAPSLIGVHSLGVSGGPIKELWFVRQGEGAIRYEVTTFPSLQGHIDFKVVGPLE